MDYYSAMKRSGAVTLTAAWSHSTLNTDNFITIYKEHITSGGKVLDGAYGAEQENEVHIRYPIPVNNHNVCGEHDAFIAAILEDKPVPTNGREGMATVKVCKAVIESADERKTVAIEY